VIAKWMKVDTFLLHVSVPTCSRQCSRGKNLLPGCAKRPAGSPVQGGSGARADYRGSPAWGPLYVRFACGARSGVCPPHWRAGMGSGVRRRIRLQSLFSTVVGTRCSASVHMGRVGSTRRC